MDARSGDLFIFLNRRATQGACFGLLEQEGQKYKISPFCDFRIHDSFIMNTKIMFPAVSRAQDSAREDCDCSRPVFVRAIPEQSMGEASVRSKFAVHVRREDRVVGLDTGDTRIRAERRVRDKKEVFPEIEPPPEVCLDHAQSRQKKNHAEVNWLPQ